jgi:hypothetical protein
VALSPAANSMDKSAAAKVALGGADGFKGAGPSQQPS